MASAAMVNFLSYPTPIAVAGYNFCHRSSASMAKLSYPTPIIAIARHIFCHPSGIPKSSRMLLALPFPSSGITNLLGGKNRARLPIQRVIAAAQSSSSSSVQSQTSVDDVGEEEKIRKCLQDVAEALILPPDFLAKLPDTLKVDLNDAAFALSSGPLNQEVVSLLQFIRRVGFSTIDSNEGSGKLAQCGETVGALVMGLSRALEKADTQTAAALSIEVPSIQENLPSDPVSNAALGKRFQAAGRYLASTGQYGIVELQKLSKALLAAGEALSLSNPNPEDRAPPKETTRMFKFGDLQVKITAQRAYIGAAIAFVFGVWCWSLTSGFANTVVDPSQYANDQSFAVASSLRGTLLTAGYFCSALSAISIVGLIALASQLGSEDTS